MMNTYFFVLGTNHTLSKIDIVNMLQRKGVEFEIVEASEEVLAVKTQEPLDIQPLMEELGSAAKIGQVFDSYPQKGFPENFVGEVGKSSFKDFFLPQYQKAPRLTRGMNGSPFGAFGTGFRTINQRSPGFQAGESSPKESKDIRFGISVYNGGGGFKNLNQTWFLAPKVAREIKERIGGGYLPVKERELSSVVVDQTGLLEKGFELVLIVGRKGIYVGKTLVIQDYESYSLRDYGRPARDAKAGMIPPKLAKMMINLAGKDKNDLFLDPFCGSGTILQELVLLGYKNLVGTDSSAKSVADSQTNLDWLFEKYALRKGDYQIELIQADVRKLSSKVSFKTISAIVTEPYLGSPQASRFNQEQIKKEVSKLEELYLAAFDEFRKVVKNGGIIVIIFPIFRFQSQFFHLEILKEIEALGFKKREFIFHPPAGGELLNLNLSSRGSAVFFRPGQTVSREVLVLEKQ